ncbi:hypothetical protein [Microbacterium ulmi]|uniref:Uncharacterized protein n=1 Tax=Microbacterium ulmi TaxID=179095 RepID=A0A7Y2M040_9MICO|nr:hypothetical protein [Microbacterium ulmi]NII70277.1 hypothetical protein [Microbacterium ulmi]NNH03324.1 hypothetical protein [Microbacterium ulmi]
MKTWLVRFVSLYVFNVVVLLLMGVLPGVTVDWSALWASVILTAATIWLKPAVTKWFAGMAAKSADQRTKTGEKLVQFGLVLVVELIIWLLVVWFSGVQVRGVFWGWILPPFALLLAWIIYDAIDDRVHARAGALYDRAEAGIRGGKTPDAAAAPPSSESRAAQQELQDGLTAEQRRMLDDLGKS